MLGTQGSSSSVISVTVGVVRYTDSKNPTTKTSTSITPVIGGPEDFGRRAVGNGSCPAVKGVLGHVSERSFPASELLVALRQQRPLRIDHDLRDKLKALEADLRKLYPESDSEFTQLLDRCFEKLGAYRSLYFQQYTGGQYREVLKHIGRLRADLQHPTYGNLAADAAVDNVLRALELLGQVQSFTVSRHLADEEVDQLEHTVNELRDHLVQSHPNLKPGHKFHIILKHLVPFARRWKTVNLFSEQAIESAHNVVNRMSARITSRDKRMKLSLIMRWFKEQNILIDQYGTVSGAE